MNNLNIDSPAVLHYIYLIMAMDILEDKEKRDKLRFVTFIIPEFARTYKMDKPEAYRYLKKYGGVDFIFEHWWALHTDNPFCAVHDIYKICLNNGGIR